MKVEKSNLPGSKYCVVWNDGSRSHYATKKIALKEMRRELALKMRYRK